MSVLIRSSALVVSFTMLLLLHCPYISLIFGLFYSHFSLKYGTQLGWNSHSLYAYFPPQLTYKASFLILIGYLYSISACCPVRDCARLFIILGCSFAIRHCPVEGTSCMHILLAPTHRFEPLAWHLRAWNSNWSTMNYFFPVSLYIMQNTWTK